MTTLAPEPVRDTGTTEEPESSQELFALLDAMDLPRGVRAEILDGETITVSPTPSGLHQENVFSLGEQLRPHMPEGYRPESYLEIRMPFLERSVVPDLYVAPRSVLRTREHEILPDEVVFVAEVVSKGSRYNDRAEKAEIYATAAIELYLLIDPFSGQVTLYSNPADKRYKDHLTRDFGEKLPLPKPFDFELDTGEFVSY